MEAPFLFKEFAVHQDKTAMKIGTDAVLLGAWCSLHHSPHSILDVGSGTGVLALMLAQRSGAAVIDAVEIEQHAYEQTVENFERSNWNDRLFCYHASFQEFVDEMKSEAMRYDLIISNPPFYTDDRKSKTNARHKARFTISLSFEDLLTGVASLLAKEGVFSAIIPFQEEQKIINLAEKTGIYPTRICRVRGNPTSKIKRSLLEFSTNRCQTQISDLVIETNRHQYTADYINLTKAFYLNM